MEKNSKVSEEERIEVLEMKCRETDAQIRAVLAEMRDLRVILDRMVRQPAPGRKKILAEEPAVPEEGADNKGDETDSPPDAAPQEKNVVVRPRQSAQKETAPKAAEPSMVNIMQPDGTFRMEPRRGEDTMMDSSGAWDVTKKSTSFKGRKKP
ncbi:MAG: hypothetical protein GX651_03680 [Methanomicrobiales archaeon]|nr:hypothetical protein [Methanomicrobiales archaeon]